MTPDISTLYANTDSAKLASLWSYKLPVRQTIAPSADVTLTGHGAIWLYLGLAPAWNYAFSNLRFPCH